MTPDESSDQDGQPQDAETVESLEDQNRHLRNLVNSFQDELDMRPAESYEVRRLNQWKAEATEVLDGWHQVFKALGSPGRLGELHYEAAVTEVERLRRIASERVLPELPDAETHDLGWWSISGEDFMDAMRRAYLGEEPGALYVEYYVNSDTESVEGNDE
jgi:hypothetical protein